MCVGPPAPSQDLARIRLSVDSTLFFTSSQICPPCPRERLPVLLHLWELHRLCFDCCSTRAATQLCQWPPVPRAVSPECARDRRLSTWPWALLTALVSYSLLRCCSISPFLGVLTHRPSQTLSSNTPLFSALGPVATQQTCPLCLSRVCICRLS